MAKPIEIEFTANFEKYMQKVVEAQNRTASSAQNMENSFNSVKNSITNIAGVLGVTFGATALLSFAKSAIEGAAKLEVLRSNFQGTSEDIELFKKATAGTVSEAGLLKLSNQATDLGLSMKQQAILMSLAEDAADKYGGSVEEGFQKVIKASEGGTKGLKDLGIQKAVYDSIVKSYVDGYGVKNIEQLDAETQKWIKVEAMIKAAGVTLDDVRKKQKDHADEIESLTVKWEEFKDAIGANLIKGLLGVVDAFEKLQKQMDKINENKFLRFINALGSRGMSGSPNDIVKTELTPEEAAAARKMFGGADMPAYNKALKEQDELMKKRSAAFKSADMPPGIITGKNAGKENLPIVTDETIQKELAQVKTMLAGNVSLRERNDLLKKRKELEDKLYDAERFLGKGNMDYAGALIPKGAETVQSDKKGGSLFIGSEQNGGKNPLDQVYELDEGWQQVRDHTLEATRAMASGLARAIVYGQNLNETLANIGTTILESGLQMLISIGLKAGFMALGVPEFLFANGGVIGEPVVGMGLNSRQSYLFGEAGNEIVMPANRFAVGGSAGAPVKMDITVNGKIAGKDIQISGSKALGTLQKYGGYRG